MPVTYSTDAIDTRVNARVRRGEIVVSPQDHGALGDGAHDDTSAIRAAVTAGAATNKSVRLAAGTYRVTGTIVIPAGMTFVGSSGGASLIQVPAGVNFPVLDVDGGSRVYIGDLRIAKAAGSNASGNGQGVLVRGAASDVVVERVHVDSLVNGVYVAGGAGTTPGVCARVTLRNVTAVNSPGEYGICIDDADVVTVDACYGRGNWYDGLKLRKATKNVTVIGGAYTGNGLSGTGDGADVYAGGDRFFMSGTVFAGNVGNGITIKTGPLTVDEPGSFGYVRNIDLQGLRCTGNQFIGCYITVMDAGEPAPTQPTVANITVTGGDFSDNRGTPAADGLYVAARNVTVVGARAKRNERNGITIARRAHDVTLLGCQVAANGTAANTGIGIHVHGGRRITIMGGSVLGADSDTVVQEADLAGLTRFHTRNIQIETDARDVIVKDVHEAYCFNGAGIHSNMPAGSTCIIHQYRPGNPTTAGTFGGIGSTHVRTDATGTDAFYDKVSGAPNTATAGWSRRLHGATATSTVDFGAVAAGAVVTRTVAMGSAANVSVGDAVVATGPADFPAGVRVRSWVSAANTVTVEACNVTAGSITPASGSWRVAVIKI